MISTIVKNFVLMVFFVTISLYLGGTLIPTLNPEKEIGGSFDLSYMISYAYEYSTRISDQGYAFGRINTTSHTINLVSQNLQTFLFGFGPDSLSGQETGMERAYHFGIYYGLTGFTSNLLTVGWLGAAALVTFIVNLFLKAKAIFKNASNRLYKALSFAIIVSSMIFLLDYFTYSASFLHGSAIFITYLYIAGFLLNTKIQQ